MRREKREFDSRSSFSDHPSKRRMRHTHGHSSKHDLQGLIASESSHKADEQLLRSTPSLTEIRQARKTEADWPWDKAPAGCESISVTALKLFGAVSPTSDYSLRHLPEELTKLRRPKPLKPENSWIYRTAGNKIYSTIVDAIRETRNDNRRPFNLPSFEGLFTSSDAALIQNVTSLDEIVSRYGPVTQHEKIDLSTFVVKFESKHKLEEPDRFLNETKEAHPVVEILNAASPKSRDNQVIEAIRALCDDLGQPVKRIWMKKHEDACPYTLTRVFVELEDKEKTINLAKELGEKFIEGRPLVTTTNSCIDLQ